MTRTAGDGCSLLEGPGLKGLNQFIANVHSKWLFTCMFLFLTLHVKASNSFPVKASRSLPVDASNSLPLEANHSLPVNTSNSLPVNTSRSLPVNASPKMRAVGLKAVYSEHAHALLAGAPRHARQVTDVPR